MGSLPDGFLGAVHPWGAELPSRRELALRPCISVPAGIEAHRLSSGWRVVPDTVTTARLLATVGVDVGSPILRHYDWPGATPFEVQRRTAALLTMQRSVFVFNGMGTGKSRSVLWAFDFLQREGAARRMLVIAPLSILGVVWGQQCLSVNPKWRLLVLRHSNPEKRAALLDTEHDICIVNPDLASRMLNELQAQRYDTLVFDEASMYRNAATRRSRMAARLASLASRVWLATATPTPRAPSDAFGLLKIVRPNSPLCRSFVRFRDLVEIKRGPFRWEPKPDAQETLARLLQPSTRYSLTDVMEAPAVSYVYRTVPMSAHQRTVYDALRRKLVALDGEVLARNSGVLLNKLLQVACGVVYGSEGVPVELVVPDDDARLQACVAAVAETERNAIVFAPFLPVLDRVAAALSAAFDGDRDVHEISGKTAPRVREEIFGKFQRLTAFSRRQVIVAQPSAMAHGLTLTSANLIVWYAPTWDLEVYEQGNGRIVRPGQTDKVQIVHLISAPSEKHVYKMLRQKNGGQQLLLSALRSELN